MNSSFRLLDSIRGVAALVVLVAHIIQVFILPLTGLSTSLVLINQIAASYAVLVFFVLSGLVITGSILRNRTLNEKFDVQNFLVSRVARIFPPFLFSVLFCVCIFMLVSSFNMHGSTGFKLEGDLYVARESLDLDWEQLYLNILMMQGVIPEVKSLSMNGPLWSISYEWWAYMMAMFFSLWILNRSVVIGGAGFLGGVFFVYYFQNLHMAFFLLCWVLGAIVYLSIWNGKRISDYLYWPLLVFLIFVIVNEVYFNSDVIRPYRGLSNYVFQIIVLIVAIMLFTKFKNLFEVVLSPFSKLAKCSYTLYILHFPLLLLEFSLLHEFYHEASIVVQTSIVILIFVANILVAFYLSKILENVLFFKFMLRSLFELKVVLLRRVKK